MMEQLTMVQPKVSLKNGELVGRTASSDDSREPLDFTSLLKDKSGELEAEEALAGRPARKEQAKQETIPDERGQENSAAPELAGQIASLFWQTFSLETIQPDGQPVQGADGAAALFMETKAPEETGGVLNTALVFTVAGQEPVQEEVLFQGTSGWEKETDAFSQQQPGYPGPVPSQEGSRAGGGIRVAGFPAESAGQESADEIGEAPEEGIAGNQPREEEDGADMNSLTFREGATAAAAASAAGHPAQGAAGPLPSASLGTPVREQAAVLPTSPDSLGEDLGKVLDARLTGKDQVLELELEPASLGKLTIRASYENGRASISILASDPKTLEILNRHAGELGAILEGRTGQATIVYTSGLYQEAAQQEAPSGGREQRGQQQKPRQEKRHSDDFAQQLRLGLI